MDDKFKFFLPIYNIDIFIAIKELIQTKPKLFNSQV